MKKIFNSGAVKQEVFTPFCNLIYAFLYVGLIFLTSNAFGQISNLTLAPQIDPNFIPSNIINPTILTTAVPAGPGATDAVDVHVFPSANPQSEVHISINKTDLNNILISTNTFWSLGNSIQGYYFTNDGGITWSGDDVLPNNGGGRGDPATAFDADGNGYLVTMSSPNTFANPDGYFLQKTTDNGLTWLPQVRGYGPVSLFFDKEMVATDDAKGSPFVNNFYCAWSEFTSGSDGFVKFNRSTDGGTTFSSAITLRDNNGLGQGVNVQTGPNGEVYVCWADYGSPTTLPASSIGFALSTDGGQTFTTTQNAFSYVGIRTLAGPNTLFGNTRVNDFPAMAVDKSYCSFRGRIYITYAAQDGSGDAIIQIRHSDDNGSTWSSANTINISLGRQNWFPWIAVDDITGEVSVVYYSLDQTTGFSTNTYVAFSNNGGATWGNIKVSDVSHITAPIPGFGGGYAGDYIGITSYNGVAYSSWMDDRNGTWQVYFSPVTYPLFSPFDFVNYTVTGTETWTTDRIIIGTLTIENGAVLNIQSGVRIQFGPSASVVVKPGGSLNLFGTLTGLDAPCPSTWNGVLVEAKVIPPFNGNFLLGELFMDNAVIEHAIVGVEALGTVTAINNSTFFNNKVNVNLKGVFAINHNKNESIFTGCNFTFTPPLRDGSTDPVTFVDIEDVFLGLPPEFVNNNFVNTIPATPLIQKPIAINAVNSKFFTMGNTFNELFRGIWSINTLAGLETNLNIKQNSFIETRNSIRIDGGRFDVIENNTITGTDLTGSVSSSTSFFGIFLVGTSGFTIQDNTINTTTYGIRVLNSAPNGGEIHFRNIFTNCWRDIDVRGNNANLQIKCNEFNGNHASAINVFFGNAQFPDQGTCLGNDNTDPAGNDFNGGNFHIFSLVPFNYNHHSNGIIFPNVEPLNSKITANITLNDCGQVKTFQSCFTSAFDVLPDNVPEKALMAIAKALERKIEREPILEKRELLINHLIILYLKINQREKAIAYLEQHSTIAHKKILIGSYIRSGEFTKAAQLINIIPQNNLDNQNFVKYHNVLLNLGINNKTIYQINGQQEQDVRDVAGSDASVSANAQSLLKIVFDEDAVIDLPDPDSLLNNARIAATNELLNELTKENESAKLINILPNPFNDQTIIKYYVPGTTRNAEIIVYDIVGTQVKSLILNKNNSDLVINASDLDNGIYFIRMIVDDEIVANKKIIVLK